MRDFAQSLQGDVKEWFNHLKSQSIKTWGEFFYTFLKFWGKRRAMDQILSEFYSMKKQEGETMLSFNRMFASFYYNLPKEIQPLEDAAKLYYASTFLPEFYFLLLERKSVTLQHLFIDSL